MKNRILFLALGAIAIAGLGQFRLAIAQPSPPPTVVTYDLDYGDDLPMFNGDLDSVKVENLPGGWYEHNGFTGVGPCDYEFRLYSAAQLSIDALGGELIEFDYDEIGYSTSGTGPTTVNVPLTGTLITFIGDTERTINSDTRCDNFEGTGTIALAWNAKHLVGITDFVEGCNLGPQGGMHDLTNVSIRVTYTSK